MSRLRFRARRGIAVTVFAIGLIVPLGAAGLAPHFREVSAARSVGASGCIQDSINLPSPQSLFSKEHTTVGGSRWDGVAAVRTSGDIIIGEATGSFAEVIDHRNGHFQTVSDTGPLHDVSGFDGVSWDAQNGIVTQVDLPSLQEDAATQAYVTRDGWWDPADSATMRMLGAQGGSRPYLVVEVVPHGGSPINVWFDDQSHLIAKTVARTDAGNLTTEYSDWREVNGIKLSFHQVQTDPTGGITTTETKAAEALSSVAPDMIARPKPTQQGKIMKGSSATIPFRVDKEPAGHIFVDALFDGKSALVYFDSGGANYLVPSAAKELGLGSAGGVNITGVGTSTITGGYTKIETIGLGAAQLREQTAMVAELPYTAMHPAAALKVNGLVGFEFLSQFRTTVDYSARTISFASFESPVLSTGVTVPFFSDGHSVYINATIDGETGLFGIDTGDGDGVSVFRRFAEEHKLFQTGGLEYVHAGGVGGVIPYKLFRGHTFTIGGSSLSTPIVELSETSVGGFASRSIAGNLGADILGRFRIVFDYQARTLTFIPNANIDQPFPADRTGLSLTQNVPEEFSVLAVVKGSPADDAGVRAKDGILSVNSRSIADEHLGLYDMRPYLQSDDALSLRVRRGDQVLDLVIHPRKLI